MTNDKTVTMSPELVERLMRAIDEPQPSPLYAELKSLLANHSEEPLGVVGDHREPAALVNRKAICFLELTEFGMSLPCGTKLYASPPAPVAVRKLEMANVVRAHMEIPNCPVMTSNQCHALAVKLNACLDKVKELNQ